MASLCVSEDKIQKCYFWIIDPKFLVLKAIRKVSTLPRKETHAGVNSSSAHGRPGSPADPAAWVGFEPFASERLCLQMTFPFSDRKLRRSYFRCKCGACISEGHCAGKWQVTPEQVLAGLVCLKYPMLCGPQCTKWSLISSLDKWSPFNSLLLCQGSSASLHSRQTVEE